MDTCGSSSFTFSPVACHPHTRILSLHITWPAGSFLLLLVSHLFSVTWFASLLSRSDDDIMKHRW